MNTNAHHHSVSLCKTRHGRQSAAGSCREGLKDPVVQVYSLILLEMPMGSQFGQPDVEYIVTLCLEGEKSTHPQTNLYNKSFSQANLLCYDLILFMHLILFNSMH